jgi:hypothetical protein
VSDITAGTQTVRGFENRELRKIFGPKRDEVMGGLRKLHNEELHNLFSSLSVIRMIKPRRMKWSGHIAQMWRNGRLERQKERDH